MIQLPDWCLLHQCRAGASQWIRLLALAIYLCSGQAGAEEAGEASVPPALVTAPVTKAERDHREYRHLTLANQLKVLLIADTQAPTVSMAVDIAAGYHQDPPEASGTAALLAYSLLQAQPNMARALALTDAMLNTQVNAEHTRFTLTSPNSPAALFSLLPTLSSALTTPAFSEAVLSRALTHTDADFQALLADPEARRLDVYCALFNADHPRARYCRSGIRVEQQEAAEINRHLREYHLRYYRADSITVVVRAALSLDVLEAQLVKHFSGLPGGEVDFEAPVPLVEPGRLPLMVAIRTSAGPGRLHLAFPIPHVPEHLSHQPYSVARSLLENKGQGSLQALLQELEWAENIQTYIAPVSRYEGLFEIDIELTRLGVRAQDQIVALVFHLLEKIRGRGVTEWRYAELAQLARLSFRFDENP
ncbi:MAG TPA: insulinase family protein, partial [Cellvibrionaceae bacterium]